MQKEKIKNLYNNMFAQGEKNYRDIAFIFKNDLEEEFRLEPEDEELEKVMEGLIELADTEKKIRILKKIKHILFNRGLYIEDEWDEEVFAIKGQIIAFDYSGEIMEEFRNLVEEQCGQIDSEERRREIEVCAGDIIISTLTPYKLEVESLKVNYVKVKTITGKEIEIPFHTILKVVEEDEKKVFLADKLKLEKLTSEFEEIRENYESDKSIMLKRTKVEM